MSPRICSAVAIIGLVLVACNQSEPTDIKSLLASDRPSPPQVVAHLPLEGSPFGSAVSSAGVGWIGQPDAGRVTRLDIAAGSFTGSVSPGPRPVQISPNQDGSRIYVPSFFGNGLVASVNTATLTVVNTVNTTSDPQDAYGVTNTPRGDTVFVGITNGPIFKVDMRSGTVLGTLNLPVAAGYHFAWNKNRTRLYASQRAFDGGRVFEIDPNAFTLLRTFETGGSAQGIQVSADGMKLFVAAQTVASSFGISPVIRSSRHTRPPDATATGCSAPPTTRFSLWVVC